uniref:Protein phosphatase 4, regulatory subunit 4 n=1 Tax=Nannospalax galili TaxID=1026970 RepID=A0A8C6RHG1_NANGA
PHSPPPEMSRTFGSLPVGVCSLPNPALLIPIFFFSFSQSPSLPPFKTPEEIERLTVDEDLGDIDRAVFLLSAGQDVQGTSVIANLPFLMRQNPTETLRRVLPKVREVLHGASMEMQLTAAVSFLTILQEDSMSVHTYAHSFLHVILLHLEHRDTGVSNAWLETLLSAIEVLPKDVLRHEILNPLVSKAQLSQTVQSRLVSCKILGKLTNKFDAHSIKRELLPLVKSLCQDVEYEVRSCMCRQLENIAQGIGTELTKSVVLPELLELSRDESSSVRLAAFETLVNMLDIFDTDDRSQTILPLVKTFCEKSFKADESILISLSFHLGKLCHGLYGMISLKFQDYLIFPFSSILASEFHPIFTCKTCSLSLYILELRLLVSKLLNSGVYLIHKELITLLQDESLEVLDALINHLPEILELMTTGGESSVQENKLSSLPDLIPALTAAEQRAAASLKWRTHEKLLQKYACLPHIISSDQIYYRFLQRMFTIVMTNNVLPVQRAASRTLCIFLRYNRKQEQRHEVIQKLIEQLGQGKSYWNRLRFLDTCEFIIEIFSKSFFCKYFFVPAIELSHDPVANVRMKLCYLLPKVKSALKIPADMHLLQQLEMCVRKLLCQEKDKDVLAIVKKTVLELDRMEMSMDAFQKKIYEQDLLDQEKEREELLFLEMEHLEKEKHQNDGRPSSDKMFDKKRRDSKTPTQSLPKNISISVPGPSSSTPSTSKEIKKSKLIRSQSFNNQGFHAKYGNLDKCASKSSLPGHTPVSGLLRTAVLSLTDDSFWTRNASSNSVPGSFSPNPPLPSTSRGTGTTADSKGSGSKDAQPRKATL